MEDKNQETAMFNRLDDSAAQRNLNFAKMCSISYQGSSIMIASAAGNLPLCVLLWGMASAQRIDMMVPDDEGNTPFHYACVAPTADVMQFFYQQTGGKLRNGQGLLDSRNDDGETALLRCVVSNSISVLRCLLDAGCDEFAVDKNGNSFLINCCKRSSLSMSVIYYNYIKKKHGPAKAREFLLHEDMDGHNVLDWAAAGGSARDEDPCDMKFNGEACTGYSTINFIDFLFRCTFDDEGDEGGNSIDITKTDKQGRNSLYWAAKSKKIFTFRFLVDAGVDAFQTDKHGVSAISLLLNAIANPKPGQNTHTDCGSKLTAVCCLPCGICCTNSAQVTQGGKPKNIGLPTMLEVVDILSSHNKSRGCRMMTRVCCYFSLLIRWWFSRDTNSDASYDQQWLKCCIDYLKTLPRAGILIYDDVKKAVEGDIESKQNSIMLKDIENSSSGAVNHEAKAKPSQSLEKVKKLSDTAVYRRLPTRWVFVFSWAFLVLCIWFLAVVLPWIVWFVFVGATLFGLKHLQTDAANMKRSRANAVAQAERSGVGALAAQLPWISEFVDASESMMGFWLGCVLTHAIFIAISSQIEDNNFVGRYMYTVNPILFVVLASIMVVVLILWVYVVWWVDNPGIITSRSTDFEHVIASMATNDTGLPDQVKYCRTTMVLKPLRAKYCSHTGCVVAKMDHWCVWLHGAVGFRNHRPFMLFVLLHWVLEILFLILAFSSIVDVIRTSWDKPTQAEVLSVLLFRNRDWWFFLTVSTIFNLIVGGGLTMLLSEQVHNVSSNMTSNEKINRQKYHWLNEKDVNGSLINRFDRLSTTRNCLEFWTSSDASETGSTRRNYMKSFDLPPLASGIQLPNASGDIDTMLNQIRQSAAARHQHENCHDHSHSHDHNHS